MMNESQMSRTRQQEHPSGKQSGSSGIEHETAADYSPAEISVSAVCAGLRLDAALAKLFPEHSRSRLQTWLKAGLITLDGAVANAKHKVWAGQRIVLAVPSTPTLSEQAENIALTIIYEDDSLIVINKPAGLVVHPGNGNESGTLMNALLHHAPALAQIPRAGIVHRLDKETSGLLVVAKTLEAQTDLVRQLQARSVKRHYLALVHGILIDEGVIDAPIGRHPIQRTKMAVLKYGGKEARTHVRLREQFARCTLVECQLETGRTHQIRVHMAKIGHALVGDPVYGKSRCGDALLDAFPRQALHAWRLALIHPHSGEEMRWKVPLPADFAALLDALSEA
jgi:23S rRNA pseudouridine1911/1915/1917 synthase